MRNPARKALYCFLALLAGAALIWFGADREQRIGEHWTAIVPLALGFTVAPIALVFLIQALLATRGRALLLAGHRVIARWHVYPAEWEQFRKFDARRSGESVSLANDLWIRKRTPKDAVEVIVGEKSLLIDQSYHVLRPGGLPELHGVRWLHGPPICLEFALRYPRGRYGGNVPATLRVPVPAGSRGAAQRIIDHFEPRLRRKPGLALRNPRRTYRICALLIAAAAAAGGIGYALAEGGALVPVALIIGAIIFAIFAVLLALATFLLTRGA
ncbi:MAG TPA: hypothetical protein VD846_02770 [Allosphingosinicella sp.]|nr:hypothetical protein [Allosphingosinicella sp.]